MNSRVAKNSILKWRVYLVLFFFLLVVLVIIFQLYRVQIVQGETYSKRANNQHSQPTSEIFDRGNIYFTNKDGEKISAATLKTGYTIAINPKNLENPEDLYNNLGFYIDLDEDFYISRADRPDDPYEEIAHKVSYEDGQKILDLDINSLYALRENWRFYPGKDLASHVIGFVAYDEDDFNGRYGLERQYNDLLERDNDSLFNNFFAEFFSSNEQKIKEEKVSGSLVTTINPEVQSFVQKEIDGLYQKWNSKKIGAIVMDPQSGEIFSMALAPTFDLNEFNLVEDPLIYTNDLVEGVYEMGSIMKPLTMAIGLDTDSVTPETTYNDKGSLTMDEYTVRNYDHKARGIVDMQAVLNNSLNTGVAFVVSQVGKDIFTNYIKKLIGEKTEIDLPGEVESLISNLDTGIGIEYVTASYGQGIAMSPISITRALASLGNGGKLVKPHFVKEIEYDIGVTKKVEIPEPVQVFKKETSEEISRMLVNVVDEALRGGNVALNNYSIAAKTGTAQIPSPQGGYYEDKFLHSFFGYFPAYDPRFIIFLYHIEPQGAQYASETLTEPFMNMTKFLINHYDIEPDRDGKENEENI